MLYVLFPNTVFLFQRDHVETWHMFPGAGVDECLMYVSLYIPEPAVSDSAKRHWDNNFNLLMATVELQDFPTCEGMQCGFLSGAQDSIVFGRNEPALIHFHEQIAEIAEFLHLQVEKAANRGLYGTIFNDRNIVTGDPKAGEAYFNGAGGCKNCHSVTGDLAHVASRYQPVNLQTRVRIWANSTSRWRRQPGSTGERNFAPSIAMK